MQINLIYEDEQRSASPVSLWLMIRLVMGVMLFLVAFWIVMFTVKYRSLRSEVGALEMQWKSTDPEYKAAIQTRNDLADRMDTQKALAAWRESRIAWGTQLENLALIVPEVVQLAEIRVSHAVMSVSNNIPARVFEAKFSGRTAAQRSEANVVQFLDGFKEKPFVQFVDTAVLPPGAFRQDPMVKSDRIFEIVCKYTPRLVE